MKRFLICGIFFFSVPVLWAQPTGQPTATKPDPLDEKLVKHLLGWEAKMKTVDSFFAEATQVEKDFVIKSERKSTGVIMVMKPNYARIRIEKTPPPGTKANPHDYRAWISDGKMLYDYFGPTKTMTAYKLGPGGTGNHLLFDLLRGMTAQEAVNRFHVTLLKEDKNYVYLKIVPRNRQDLSEFSEMTMALVSPESGFKEMIYLPRTISILKPNQRQTEVWDFPKPIINSAQVKLDAFKFTRPPADWKIEEGTREVPRTIPTSNQKIPVPGKNR